MARKAVITVADTSAFDQVADALYALAPGDFIAARDGAAEQARRAGDRPLAQHIHALRRPTAAAHALNLLVRAHPEYVDQLRNLGQGLLEAQQNLEGAKLRKLAGQRNALVTALTGEARRVAAAAGQPVGGQAVAELDRTLRAVLADERAAAELAAGRLTHGLTPGGALPDLPASTQATAAARNRVRAVPDPAVEAENEQRRRLEQAERTVQLLEAQRRAAESDLARARTKAQHASELLQVSQQRVAAAEQVLAQARDAAVTAKRGETAALKDVTAAEQHAEHTQRELEEQQGSLADIRSGASAKER